MSYRILTGVLIPRQTPGSAMIHFEPHDVTGDADGINLEELGDNSDFAQPPTVFVSLKHFTVKDRNGLRPDSEPQDKEMPSEPSGILGEFDFVLYVRNFIAKILGRQAPQNDKPNQAEPEVDQASENFARVLMEEYEIKNEAPTTDQMEVTWQATNGAEIREMAYLIMGKV